MQNNKSSGNKKVEPAIASAKSPNIFSIPRPYEDDYERNVAWYKKMQRLETKFRELKQSLSELSERQSIRKEKTKEIVEASRQLVNNFFDYKPRD